MVHAQPMEWVMWVMMTLDWWQVCWAFERWGWAIPEKLCWVRDTHCCWEGGNDCQCSQTHLSCFQRPHWECKAAPASATQTVWYTNRHITCTHKDLLSSNVCVYVFVSMCVSIYVCLPGALAPLTTSFPIMLDRSLVERCCCCCCLCYTVWLPGSPLGTGNDKDNILTNSHKHTCTHMRTHDCLSLLVNINHLLWQAEEFQGLRTEHLCVYSVHMWCCASFKFGYKSTLVFLCAFVSLCYWITVNLIYRRMREAVSVKVKFLFSL